VPQNVLDIAGSDFLLNGRPTYPGRHWQGARIEGLLLNSRMVQGIFDDSNPATRDHWRYPDGAAFDAERNTREFLAAMPEWRRHGLLAFTLNLQGGSPRGYSKEQPWINSALTWDGRLKPDYMARAEQILDRADGLGMVVILGIFYFGQEPRMDSAEADIRATDAVTDWLLDKQYTHVLVEIANECDVRYTRPIIRPEGSHELVRRVQERSTGKIANRSGRLYVATSLGGGQLALPNMLEAMDVVLLHGNGVSDPRRITEMVEQTRATAGYHGQPIVFNEDDHFAFEQPENNFVAAVRAGASWGYFDYRMKDEGFDEGYQSVPTNWQISSARKRGFFGLLAEMTGGTS
jgi:hypothetical protein